MALDKSFWRQISYARIIQLFLSFAFVFCCVLVLMSVQVNTIFDEIDKKLINSENTVTLTDWFDSDELEGAIRNSTVENPQNLQMVFNETNPNERIISLNTDPLSVNKDNFTKGLFEFEGIITEKASNLSAPGENGKAYNVNVSLLNEKERGLFEAGFKRHSFNQYASDKISVQRHVGDVRDPECHDITYTPEKYVDTTVIIIFFNEALSTLLRTVYSALLTSPPHLLKEIIMVDDSSEFEELQEPLLKYVTQRLPKVKLIRTPKRLGLINARVFGVKASSGMSYTFLDSHCECTEGWLEPLLERISTNWTNVAMPVINPVHHETFEFFGQERGYDARNIAIGGFHWELNFDWIGMSKREQRRRESIVDPVRSPTMAGGLFTIHRDFFKSLGFYDPEFSIYGAENLELSFKIWMCGGILEQIPCSHVGHVFRPRTPYIDNAGSTISEGLKKNKVRLAEVWMDDYKEYYYDLVKFDKMDFGNISSRLQIKTDLHCHDFEWYLKNIYPERYLPVEHLKFGRAYSGKFCLQADFQGSHPREGTEYMKILSNPCGYTPHSQIFAYITEDRTIRCDRYCLGIKNEELKMAYCELADAKQEWRYEKQNLIHSTTGLCLETVEEGNERQLSLKQCDQLSSEQKWHWQSEERIRHNVPVNS